MNHSTPGLPVHHQLPEFTQTDVHQVGDAIQPSHPLSSPSPPAPSPSQHQGLFQWVITSWQIHEEAMESVTDFIFLGSQITAGHDCSHKIKRCFLLGRKPLTNPDSVLKSRDINFASKCPYAQIYGFSSSHVWIWELNHEESWVPKNWCFWTVVLEKTLENPLNYKIKPVNPKEHQP